MIPFGLFNIPLSYAVAVFAVTLSILFGLDLIQRRHRLRVSEETGIAPPSAKAGGMNLLSPFNVIVNSCVAAAPIIMAWWALPLYAAWWIGFRLFLGALKFGLRETLKGLNQRVRASRFKTSASTWIIPEEDPEAEGDPELLKKLEDAEASLNFLENKHGHIWQGHKWAEAGVFIGVLVFLQAATSFGLF